MRSERITPLLGGSPSLGEVGFRRRGRRGRAGREVSAPRAAAHSGAGWAGSDASAGGGARSCPVLRFAAVLHDGGATRPSVKGVLEAVRLRALALVLAGLGGRSLTHRPYIAPTWEIRGWAGLVASVGLSRAVGAPP